MAMSTTRKIVLTITAIVVGLGLIGFLVVALFVAAIRGEQPSVRDNSVLAGMTFEIAGPFRR